MTDNNQKALWKATILEYLHNCLIGISHLSCSEEECPLVDNWNELEAKLSKNGKAALYKITEDNWIAVDLVNCETNDLGTYENIEIKLKSGKTRKSKPTNLEENPQPIQTSGTNLDKAEKAKEIYLKNDEFILFFNNYAHQPNLKDAESIYLEELWNIKQKIEWDRDKSKKKVFLHIENEPSEETQAKKVDAANKDYLFYIADPSITSEIKKMEVYSPGTGTQERQQLHQDLKEEFSELRRVYGIRHLTSKKEERQNNPEVELNESQFIALERDKKRERWKSIRDFEKKGFCNGEHTLTYGTAPEQIQEKAQEVKELEEASTAPPKIKEEPKREDT